MDKTRTMPLLGRQTYRYSDKQHIQAAQTDPNALWMECVRQLWGSWESWMMLSLILRVNITCYLLVSVVWNKYSGKFVSNELMPTEKWINLVDNMLL